MRRRNAHRAAAVAADGERRHARGDRRAGAGARAARRQGRGSRGCASVSKTGLWPTPL